VLGKAIRTTGSRKPANAFNLLIVQRLRRSGVEPVEPYRIDSGMGGH
jgi:hypothetical protein